MLRTAIFAIGHPWGEAAVVLTVITVETGVMSYYSNAYGIWQISIMQRTLHIVNCFIYIVYVIEIVLHLCIHFLCVM